MFHHYDSSPVRHNLVMLTLHIPMSSLSPHITVDLPGWIYGQCFSSQVSQNKGSRPENVSWLAGLVVLASCKQLH